MKILLIPFFLILSSFSHSANWGVGVGAGFRTIEDPYSPTTISFINISLLSEFDLAKRDTSFSYGFSYLEGSAEAGTSNVGQDVQGFSLFGAYKMRHPITRKFSEFYMTYGAEYLNLSHKKRHVVTDDGYLREVFGNAQTHDFSVFVYPSYKFNYNNLTSEFGFKLGVSTDANFNASLSYQFLF